MVAIGIFTLLAGGGLFYVVSWRPGQAHIEAQTIFADTIREARSFARNGKNTETWTLHMSQHQLDLIGDQTNETYSFPLPQNTTLSWQGNSSITFTEPFGFPDASKSVTMQTGALQTSYIINSYGILEKQ